MKQWWKLRSQKQFGSRPYGALWWWKDHFNYCSQTSWVINVWVFLRVLLWRPETGVLCSLVYHLPSVPLGGTGVGRWPCTRGRWPSKRAAEAVPKIKVWHWAWCSCCPPRRGLSAVCHCAHLEWVQTRASLHEQPEEITLWEMKWRANEEWYLTCIACTEWAKCKTKPVWCLHAYHLLAFT